MARYGPAGAVSFPTAKLSVSYRSTEKLSDLLLLPSLPQLLESSFLSALLPQQVCVWSSAGCGLSQSGSEQNPKHRSLLAAEAAQRAEPARKHGSERDRILNECSV